MFCDIHNHVLFGVDDGSRDLDESLAMIQQAVDAGIDTICATSHVRADINDRARLHTLRGVYSTLRHEILSRGLGVQLHLGCEIYYTSDFSLVAALDVFRYHQSSSYLLVELPPTEAPQWFADICFKLRMENVRVVLAHPERNNALMRHPQTLISYVQAGIFPQVTAGSLTGRYGPEIRKFAEKIVLSGAASLIATDAHNTSRRPFSDARPAFRETEKLVGMEIATKLFDTNPRSILNGEDLGSPELSAESEEILLKSNRKKFFFLF